jgi:hypothetical protein
MTMFQSIVAGLAVGAIFFAAFWLVAVILFPISNEPEADTYDTGDLETRRRNAGGE